MLPRDQRLTTSSQFRAVLGARRRAGAKHVVVYLQTDPTRPTNRLGLVVSKQVGNSVVRHRVARRLRHVFAKVSPALPAGTDVVVRANPAAANATSAQLHADLRGRLRRLGALRADEPSPVAPTNPAHPEESL